MISELFMLMMNWLPVLCGYISSQSFPQPLSSKEEKETLILMKQGNIEARNKLIEHNLRLVAHLVKKYDTKEETEDLISIGTIGLIKGIDTFDMDKGLKLTTYVSRCIENEILMSFRRQKHQPVLSLDDPIGQDKDGNLIRLFEVIQDPKQVNLIDKMTTDQKIIKLRNILNLLPETEKEILTLRYGLAKEEPMTQKEIAQKYNISRSYVSRIEKRAFVKLLKFFQQE